MEKAREFVKSCSLMVGDSSAAMAGTRCSSVSLCDTVRSFVTSHFSSSDNSSNCTRLCLLRTAVAELRGRPHGLVFTSTLPLVPSVPSVAAISASLQSGSVTFDQLQLFQISRMVLSEVPNFSASCFDKSAA